MEVKFGGCKVQRFMYIDSGRRFMSRIRRAEVFVQSDILAAIVFEDGRVSTA